MKNKLFLVLTAMSVLLTFGSTTAEAFSGTRIVGSIESSKVEIKASLSDEKGSFASGAEVKEELLIENNGSDCYVRVRPVFSERGEELSRCFTGIPEGWVYKEGTYYYVNILKEEESILFCKGLKLPEDMGNGDISLDFSVDALQSANMEPDFSSLSPWGSVEVSAVYSRGGNTKVNLVRGTGQETENLELFYNEDAKGLISNFDEIFTDMPRMHPGDSFTEIITLYNPAKEAKSLYLSDITDDAEILKYVDVNIETLIDGEMKSVYKGSLTGDGDDKGLLAAGTLEPGQSGELRVTAHMDENAGNEASGLSGHLALSMDAAAKGTSVSDIETGTKVRSAKTGEDAFFPRALALAGVLSAMGALILSRNRKYTGE